MTPNCIDVSTWQRGVDWNRVKAAGIRAVIIRAGFGTTKDNMFEDHYAGARAAGLAIGAYWYSYAYSAEQAVQEARACINVISGKAFEIPVYYDMEENGQMALGRTVMTEMACCFIDTVQAAGRRGGMYSSPSWFADFIDYELMCRLGYSIWLAHWASRPALESDIWQYGEDGDVPGVPGNCDVDLIINDAVIDNGDEPTPEPEPEPEPKPTPEPEPTPEPDSDAPALPPDAPTVAAVQAWLNDNYDAGLAVDGIYGRLTKAALVCALQTELNRQCDAGLVVDGIFGAQTKAAVFNVGLGRQGNITRTLQGLLICTGFNPSGFTGYFGAGTEAAVREFQYRAGLVVDGVAGKATFAALCT